MLYVRFLSLVSMAVIAGALFVADGHSSESAGQDRYQFINTDVTAATNLHFSGRFCDECHTKIPQKDGDAFLRFNGDFTQLCRCHGYSSETYIHPVDIVPSEEKRAKMPEDFPLKNGKISCMTCHDMYKQCQENKVFISSSAHEKKFYRMEMMFLRGGRLTKRTDICFRCHNEQQYKKLNPHVQLTDSGDVIEETCLYCHTEKPDVNRATFEDVKLIGDLKILCQRCHGTMERHPGSIDHYRIPSEKLYTRMKLIEQDFNVVLPLDYDGKITCTTCHNPHDDGVIPAEKKGAKGADESFRHRIPKLMCISCHKM